jgi:hypothetical protein
MRPKGIIALFLIVFIAFSVYGDDFRAYYTKFNSGQKFEKYTRTGPYADVVVEVGGGRLIFWRASSYLPFWKTDKCILTARDDRINPVIHGMLFAKLNNKKDVL